MFRPKEAIIKFPFAFYTYNEIMFLMGGNM